MSNAKTDPEQDDLARYRHNDHHGYVECYMSHDSQQHELIILRCYWTRCISRPTSTISVLPRLFPGRRDHLPGIRISSSQRDCSHLARSFVGSTHPYHCLSLHANPHQVVLGCEQRRSRPALLVDHRSSLPSLLEMAHWRSSPSLSSRLQAEPCARTDHRKWIPGDHVRSKGLHRR
jgi:hypothetical protein